MDNCGILVHGYVEELKEHFKVAHKLNTRNKNSTPFKCSECASTYFYFFHLKKHILQHHPRPVPVPVTNEDLLSQEQQGLAAGPELIEYSGIRNPYFFEQPIALSQFSSEMTEQITQLRSDVALTETKVQVFLDGCSSTLRWSQKYMVSVMKDFTTKKGLKFDDPDVVELFNALEIPNVFNEVRTAPDNLNYLAMVAKCPVPEPREIVLGKRKYIKHVFAAVPKNKKFQKPIGGNRNYTKKNVVEKDVAHYISIIDTLCLIMSNPKATEMVHSEEPQYDQTFSGFKDGSQFRDHPFLQRFPYALRFSMHIDDIEVVNPLGSRKGKKKLTVVSFKIQNMNPAANPNLSNVYLALMVPSKMAKKYGFNVVLQPLIQDLKALESDAGVHRTIDGKMIHLHGVLVNVVGDTLAVHELFEMLGPQANYFCRQCYIKREDLESGIFGEKFELRTSSNIEEDIRNVEAKVVTATDCGIAKRCSLHALQYFNAAENWTFDPMHDILEGVGGMIVKLILHDAVVVTKIIDINTVNLRIKEFEYGDVEASNKPSPNFTVKSLKAKSNAISQSASQSWLLIRSFPFIFPEIISSNEMHASLIRVLLRIVYVSFSTKVTIVMVDELRDAIAELYVLFKQRFTNINPINKLHHISHYAQIVEKNQPISNGSCITFEAKFKTIKSQARNCNNFRNLTLSLTKRLNLKQINEILKHTYEVDKIVIISKGTCEKAVLDFKFLLFDFPNEITLIDHYKINNTSFIPGLVVKFKRCEEKMYGILLATATLGEELICIIQDLNVNEYCPQYNSYRVLITQNITRTTTNALYSRKTYNLWKINNELNNYLYISLKYFDE